ncbi:MAG: hypothetical protein IJ724_06625, partial [Muribaculaceae bacterium]|nr:hypothetical protein [Muribaculaceae bacterium]
DIDFEKGVESTWKGKEKMVAPSDFDSTLVLFPLEVSVFNEPSGFLKKSDDLCFYVDVEFLKGKKMKEVYKMGLVSTF